MFWSAKDVVGYAELLSSVAKEGDAVLESVKAGLVGSLARFVDKFTALSDDDLSEARQSG